MKCFGTDKVLYVAEVVRNNPQRVSRLVAAFTAVLH